jgi:hypothetical protein
MDGQTEEQTDRHDKVLKSFLKTFASAPKIYLYEIRRQGVGWRHVTAG